MPQKQCVLCQKDFESIKGARFCSSTCQKKSYYLANKKRFIEKNQKWRAENPERRRELRKAEYWKDPEGNREKTKAWIAEHKEEKALQRRLYNDKIRHGSFKTKLIEQFGPVCMICKAEGKVHAHHTQKGTHEYQVLLCPSCHAKVHRGSAEVPSIDNLNQV